MVKTCDETPEPSEAWYSNQQSLVMVLLLLAAAISLPHFRTLNDMFPSTHPAIVALLSGFIVTLVVYLPMKYADSKYALSSAILIGLLVAEFLVYGAPKDLPAPVLISFFFFMFYYGRAESDHLWPKSYK